MFLAQRASLPVMVCIKPRRRELPLTIRGLGRQGLDTQHTPGRKDSAQLLGKCPPLQDREPSEQGPGHLQVRDPFTLMSHCQAGHPCRELPGREEAITKATEALECASAHPRGCGASWLPLSQSKQGLIACVQGARLARAS